MGRPPILRPGEAQSIPFAVNLDGLEFTQSGGFAFAIFIDGTPIRRLPFRVLDAARQNLGAA